MFVCLYPSLEYSFSAVCVCVCESLVACFCLCAFSHVYSYFVFCVCVYVHPASVHVGEPRPGVRGEEGSAGPFAAAWTSGSGQCGLCRSCDGGDVHLPLAAGALWVSVWPACLVQHRGRTWQHPQHARASERTTGKSVI